MTRMVHLRVPVDLLRRLKAQAKIENRNVTNLIVTILLAALPEREKAAR